MHAELAAAYDDLVARGLKLDLTRGKPSPAQLDLSNELLSLPGEGDYTDAAGADCRNYGNTQGLPEIREIFAPLLNVPVDQLVAGDNASLSIMHDTLVYSLLKGTVDSVGPWGGEPVKFICPIPGYDRHFALCEQFGIKMIPVPMNRYGPDLDQVRAARGGRPGDQGHLGRAHVRQPQRRRLPRGRHPRAARDADRGARLPDLLGQRVRRPPPDRCRRRRRWTC